MLKLEQYPAAIAHNQNLLIEAEEIIRELKEVEMVHRLRIKRLVAFDPELKNENQRAVKSEELLMTDGDFDFALKAVNNKLGEKARLEITLELLGNEFAVAKLEARRSLINRGFISEF